MLIFCGWLYCCTQVTVLAYKQGVQYFINAPVFGQRWAGQRKAVSPSPSCYKKCLSASGVNRALRQCTTAITSSMFYTQSNRTWLRQLLKLKLTSLVFLHVHNIFCVELLLGKHAYLGPITAPYVLSTQVSCFVPYFESPWNCWKLFSLENSLVAS